jgi:hypothetical protein
MKKIVAIAGFAGLLTLAACGQSNTPAAPASKRSPSPAADNTAAPVAAGGKVDQTDGHEAAK